MLEIYRFFHGTNSSIWDNTVINAQITLDMWHNIELRGKIGNGDGAAELWLDGTLIGSSYGLTNDNYNIESLSSIGLHIGNGTNYTADGEYFYIDDIIANKNYIANYVD